MRQDTILTTNMYVRIFYKKIL